MGGLLICHYFWRARGGLHLRMLGLGLGDGAMLVGGGRWWRYALLPFSLGKCFLCVLVVCWQSAVCGAPLGVVAGVRTHVMESTEEMGVSMSTYT
jgi:hypothetical protein